jgi:exodeoxyribonuclease VII large subunit
MTELFAAAGQATGRSIYSVSRLNREARFVLNECFGTLWIEGEISNFAAPASGHLYFTLKDAGAQVRCAMFKPQARLLSFKPRNGDLVLAKAEVGLYEPRGEFQLIVDTLEAAGDGALLRAFEALKQRLAAEGLFAVGRKKPLPELPRCIGLITSPTGAAVRDVLTVLRRRFPAIPVIVFPVRVQGAEAQADIVRALAVADRLHLCDVLILARGGGALEDLWTFNEEAVARAIFATETPVVSAIGHETDFTIADFVADLRAATPSAAAEAVSPDATAWLEQFRRLEARLGQAAANRLSQAARHLHFAERRLQPLHPSRRLTTQSQRLDELEIRLRRAIHNGLMLQATRLQAHLARLRPHRPEPRLERLTDRSRGLEGRLRAAIGRLLESKRHGLAARLPELEAVSPLATLARGYSLTTRAADGRLIRTPAEAPAGTRILTRLAEGQLLAIVAAGPAPEADP